VQTACGTYTAGFGIDEQLSTLSTASVNGNNKSNKQTEQNLMCHGSVHHITILTEKPNKMQQCIKILLFLILNAA